MPERLAALRDASAQARRIALAAMPGVRARASDVVSPDEATPEEVGELLFDFLADDDFGVRQEAVRLASRSGATPPVLATLERALCDESSASRRSSAMEAFGKLGAGAVPSLARLSDDVRPGVRRLAVDALGLTRAPDAFDVLFSRCNDPAPAVRAASLEALTRLGDERSVRRVEDVVARRDEAATVVLAGLLGLDALGRILPPSHIRPHLADPLTAAPALRLLGRAGDPLPLLEVLARGRGARQRAAAVGLGHSLVASPAATRAAIVAERDRIQAALIELCSEAELSAAAGALFVAAAAGIIDAFVAVARRADRGVFSASAHRAAAMLATDSAAAAARLQELAASETDAAAGALLDEIAEGLRPFVGPDASERASAARPAATTRSVASSSSSSRPSLVPMAPLTSPFAVDRPALSEHDFGLLSTLFHKEAGLLFESHAAWRLEARLAPRLKACGLDSWSDYLRLLKRPTSEGRAELAAALERVTVHETYFFRERYQLDTFAKEVLPALVGRKTSRPMDGVRALTRGTLRILSAGCSTGEEAWTIAILLEQSGLFGSRSHNVGSNSVASNGTSGIGDSGIGDSGIGGALEYEVVGVDIAPSIIDAARQARYGRRGFRGDVPDDVMKRWFSEEGKNHVVTGLRDRVRFHVGNLLDPADLASLGHFDVVFCRNVLIYMSDPARTGVIRHLYERLHPGGVLFLGHSESLLNVESGFRFLPLERELAYLRPLDAGRRNA